MSQKLDTRRPNLKALLTGDQFKQQVALALPKHLAPERFIRIAVTAMTRTPKLAECDPASFFKALLDLSSYGLEPDGRRAHLIPFNNNKLGIVECQLIIDYKGLIELAKRSGDVKSWRGETVCEADSFDWKNGEVTHGINWRKPRGDVQAVYSAVTMEDGTTDFEVMTKDDVEAIRKRSRSANAGPWVTDWAEMAKKTVMRRHSKRLTLSPEFHEAIMADIERDAMPANAIVVETARVPEFLPSAQPRLAPAEQVMDAQPFAAAEQPQEPAADPPTRRRRQAAPPPEAPPLTLSDDPETSKQKLARRIAEDGLDLARVHNWLYANKYAELDGLDEFDAASVIELYDALKEAAQ